MTLELVAGQFELTFQNAPVILPYVKRGQVRALAVTTANRAPFAPELPTVAESLPGFEIGGRAGLLAPRGTPEPIIKKVYADMATVMAMPTVREHFTASGYVVVASRPEEFAASLTAEINRWAPIIKASGAKAD
jgi:tripartite-type tricarboxylate transporter receptor subunit TctC